MKKNEFKIRNAFDFEIELRNVFKDLSLENQLLSPLDNTKQVDLIVSELHREFYSDIPQSIEDMFSTKTFNISILYYYETEFL